MYARIIAAFYFALSLALLAAAIPGGAPPPATTTVTVTAPASAPTDACSTGPVQCCNSVGSANDPAFGLLLGLLGIVVDGVDVLLGVDCSPIKVVGLGGGSCDSNVVCCENNNVGGLISIGCIVIIL
ncbi:fungal hydrophobin [Epithele typhae]|uniref:fungal hydrophobin n=1 Tax=Epithele typhae TaxID=378194 RepID=UPI002008D402|nr:fungal hydrophobin [Epithele typhae]KAH9919989.1 fungal hydrophobin [Epithele typhae]